jgi:hypothetical protein
LRDRHGDSWDGFSVYLTIGDSHLKELESLLLRIVKPPANRVIGKFASSQDIRREFAKDIRLQQRNELISLLGKVIQTEEEEILDLNRKLPVLAKYITAPIKLRAKFKGKIIKANARRDGFIRFGGRTFSFPSQAAAKACKRRTCNGWNFWNYERPSGDWVRLIELRK